MRSTFAGPLCIVVRGEKPRSELSLLMRLLLSRVTSVVALFLLLAVGIGQPASREQVVVAQSVSVAIRREPAPPSVADHVLLRQLAMARATPTPAPPAAPTPASHVVATAARVTKPASPAHVALGSGQWGLINQDRAAAGLAPLQWSDCLANVAAGQAARMAAQGYISHANGRILDLGCHLGTQAGENIGYQGGGINDAAMNAWFMGDAPHRANILGPYHDVGVAWVTAPNGTAYLAVEFG